MDSRQGSRRSTRPPIGGGAAATVGARAGRAHAQAAGAGPERAVGGALAQATTTAGFDSVRQVLCQGAGRRERALLYLVSAARPFLHGLCAGAVPRGRVVDSTPQQRGGCVAGAVDRVAAAVVGVCAGSERLRAGERAAGARPRAQAVDVQELAAHMATIRCRRHVSRAQHRAGRRRRLQVRAQPAQHRGDAAAVEPPRSTGRRHVPGRRRTVATFPQRSGSPSGSVRDYLVRQNILAVVQRPPDVAEAIGSTTSSDPSDALSALLHHATLNEPAESNGYASRRPAALKAEPGTGAGSAERYSAQREQGVKTSAAEGGGGSESEHVHLVGKLSAWSIPSSSSSSSLPRSCVALCGQGTVSGAARSGQLGGRLRRPVAAVADRVALSVGAVADHAVVPGAAGPVLAGDARGTGGGRYRWDRVGAGEPHRALGGRVVGANLPGGIRCRRCSTAGGGVGDTGHAQRGPAAGRIRSDARSAGVSGTTSSAPVFRGAFRGSGRHHCVCPHSADVRGLAGSARRLALRQAGGGGGLHLVLAGVRARTRGWRWHRAGQVGIFVWCAGHRTGRCTALAADRQAQLAGRVEGNVVASRRLRHCCVQLNLVEVAAVLASIGYSFTSCCSASTNSALVGRRDDSCAQQRSMRCGTLGGISVPDRTSRGRNPLVTTAVAICTGVRYFSW
eukprot:ctg_94.g56